MKHAVLVALLVGASMGTVAAGPILPVSLTITGGSATFLAGSTASPEFPWGQAALSVQGAPTFQLAAGGVGRDVSCFLGCLPGEEFSPSFFFRSDSGSLTLEGQTAGFSSLGGFETAGGVDLTLSNHTSSPFVVPNISPDSFVFEWSFRADGDGGVPWYLPPATPDANPTFGSLSLNLAGSGRATGTFVFRPNEMGEQRFWFQEVRFAFEDPTVVPEPASLLLLGTGVVVTAFARRRRRPPTSPLKGAAA